MLMQINVVTFFRPSHSDFNRRNGELRKTSKLPSSNFRLAKHSKKERLRTKNVTNSRPTPLSTQVTPRFNKVPNKFEIEKEIWLRPSNANIQSYYKIAKLSRSRVRTLKLHKLLAGLPCSKHKNSLFEFLVHFYFFLEKYFSYYQKLCS